MALLDSLEIAVTGSTRPDLTFIFDIDPAIGLARAKSRGNGSEDRYERKGLAFHEKLRKGFLKIAAAEPGRCRIVDASGSIEDVKARIAAAAGNVFHG